MSHSTLVTDYLGYGVIASRPSAPNLPTGCAGWYIASDTGECAIWNGSTWVDVAGLNTISYGTGIASSGSIFGSGTLTVNYRAGTLTTIGTGLNLSSGTLTATGSGTVTQVVGGPGTTGGTITSTGTISGLWQGSTVTAQTSQIVNTSGTLSVVDTQGTLSLSGTTTGTVTPANNTSFLVNVGTASGTISVAPGYQGQKLRLEVKQGATAHTVTFDSTVSYGTTVTSYTATNSASARDLLQMFCVDGTHWALAAISQGFTI